MVVQKSLCRSVALCFYIRVWEELTVVPWLPEQLGCQMQRQSDPKSSMTLRGIDNSIQICKLAI